MDHFDDTVAQDHRNEVKKPRTNRSAGIHVPLAETAVLVILLLLGLLAVIGARVVSDRLEPGFPISRELNPAGITRVLSADQARALMTEASLLRGADGQSFPSIEWADLLQTDPNALGIFLLRSLTTVDYLSQQKDDVQFARDVRVLLEAAGSERLLDEGTLPADPMLSDAGGETGGASDDPPRQTRVAWLRQAVLTAGFSPDGLGEAPPLTGHLETMATTGLVPESGDTLVGSRSVSTVVDIKPDPALANKESWFAGILGSSDRSMPLTIRQVLYLDGQVLAASPVITAVSPQSEFILTMDVRHQASGTYQARLLALGCDGRGVYREIGSIRIPEVFELGAGDVRKMSLEPDAKDLYVSIPADTSGTRPFYALTVVRPDAPVAAELFDIDGTLIAHSDNPDDQWEALRGFGSEVPSVAEDMPADGSGHFPIQEPASQDFAAYARLLRPDREATEGQGIRFTLVQSVEVACDNSSPDTIYAVMGRNETGLELKGTDGQVYTRPQADVRLIDLAARLSDLELIAAGRPVDLYPVFDPEVDRYGLYLPSGMDVITLDAWASEGSFSNIAIVHEQEGRPPTPRDPGDPFALQGGEQTLAITVTNKLGATRTYRLHVLLPAQDQTGYHTVLESFPESYRSALYLMHVKQPHYVFKALQTDLTFDEFVDAQTFQDRSLVDAAHAPESWVVPGSPVYDGRSWKAASHDVVAYFADPRNFLNEQDLFQFETLSFDATTQTLAAVQAMLAGTFMAPDHEKAQAGVDYAGLVMRAAEQAGISPLFIAAKIIQEMGRNGESPLAFGQLPGYEGVYNFFNIGATPDPAVQDGARINGARFALYGRSPDEREITADEEAILLPWTTPERAIIGGATWIARGYIAIGQDTLYLQKFDLVSEDGLFIHQYAQNIQMAWAEGRRTYRAYQDMGLLDRAFSFTIPVFRDMPTQWPELPS